MIIIINDDDILLNDSMSLVYSGILREDAGGAD